MITFLFRKLYKNKWLILSLLVGFVIAVSTVTSIPMYSSGILKRVFVKDVETFAKNERLYPGTFYATKTMTSKPDPEEFLKYYKQLDLDLSYMIGDLGLSSEAKKINLKAKDMYIGKINEEGNPHDEKGPGFSLETVSGIENYISFKEGNVYNTMPLEDGTFEAIISEKTQNILSLSLNETYYIRKVGSTDKDFFKFKVVGVFEPTDIKDSYWSDKNLDYSNGILISAKCFTDYYVPSPKLNSPNINYSVDELSWYYALDHSNIKLINLKGTLENYNKLLKNLKYKYNLNVNFPMYKLLYEYEKAQSQLKITLWTIQAPVLFMIMLYVFMISGLIIERDSNEIALLKSRGSNNLQIFTIYLLEFSIIGIIGSFIGPFIALLMCKILGASNGFLKFVNRSPLEIYITWKEWLYSFGTGLIFVITMLIPTMTLSRNSIVEIKRKKHRSNKPLWQRFYLDFILFGASIYSLYSYKNLEKLVKSSSLKSGEIPISPVMYISLTLFITSLGLICLRFYPYLIKLILKLGKNKWSATNFASLINVSRNKNKDGFLMIFLILTISIGIFNLKSASTINTMAENKIKYLNGADIVISPWWLVADLDEPSKDPNAPKPKPMAADSEPDEAPNLRYKEPDSKSFTNIEGIESITKVMKSIRGTVTYGKNISKIKSQVIAITPDEFGKTAWFDSKLLPYHWYNYLNLIAKEPKGILVSNNLKEDLNLELGSVVDLRLKDTLYMECYVYGFVDYWPSYDPGLENTPGLVVMNYNYLTAMAPSQPYDIWIKKKPDVSNETIYKSIENNNLSYQNIKTVHEGLYNLKNDPILQGTNGTLNLCFLSSMAITCMGFIIYWTLSIKNRTLQFGILRAMGLSMKEILKILINEQVLISGISIILGVFIGALSSNLFMPMLNLSANSKEKILPFKAISQISSYFKLTGFMIFILIISIFILAKIVKKIKIDQALKLGED